MAGAAIVSNPYEGVERWFEPGQELLVARDEGEATTLYSELLADPTAAEELGRRARERALDEHTYAHRARRVLDLLGLTSQAAEPVEAARG
jgi:spore maturation protein CgeB